MFKNFDVNPETLKKCLAKALPKSFTWIGIAFSVYTMLKAFVPTLLEVRLLYALILWGVLYAVAVVSYLHKTYNHPVSIAGSDNTINMHFKNILSFKEGIILVGIDDTLDCQAADVGHLHEQIRDKYGQNWPNWMKDAFQNAQNPNGNGKYPIGYSFVAPSPNQTDEAHLEFLFLVMAKSQPQGGSAQTSREFVYQAVRKLFNERNLTLKTTTLYTPILGAGGNHLSLEQSAIARDIACAFVCATQKIMPQGMPIHKLHIVFRPERQSEIDMAEMNEQIDHCVKQCRECPNL